MANREDAALLVQLAQWGTNLGIQEAMRTVFADEFDPETATDQDDAVSRLLTFGETIATLTKNDLLDTALVLDWLWIAGLWAQVGPAALKARAKLGVPQMYENLEALAARQ